MATTVVLCLTMLFAQLPQVAFAAPSLTLSVSCGPAAPASTTVTATGAGFGASQPIIYELLTGAGTVVFGGVQTSLVSGGFTLIFEVQQGAGTYTFRTAQDQNGNRAYDAGEPVATAQFTVPCVSGGGGDAAPASHAARLYALMNSFGSPASSIEVVSLATMTSAGTISLGARSVESFAVSPNGQRAYVADTTNNAVAVIDLATGTQLATLAAPNPRDVVLDPTGAILYVSTTGKLLAFSTASNAQLRELLPQTTSGRTSPDSFLSLAASPDGATIAIIGFDGSGSWVYLVDAATFSLLARFLLTNPGEPSNCATFPNDLVFASAARLLLWDSNCDNLYEVDVANRVQNTARTIRLGRDDGSSSNFNNALSYSAAADKAFVHTEGGAYGGSLRGHLGVFDTAATTGSAAVGLGGTPFGTVVTPDGTSAYVAVVRSFATAGANDVLDQYDISTNALHENAYVFATAGQSVRDMKILAGVSSITGVAQCGDLIGTSVVLRSGSAVVDQQSGLVNGAFAFTNTAPNSTYGLDYTAYASGGVIVPVLVAGPPPPPVTCSVTVTTDALWNATAPAGGFIPDLANHTWTSAFRLNPQEGAAPGVTKFGQTDYVAVSGRSDWYVVHIAPGQRILVKLTGTGGTALPADLSLALFKDIRAYLTAQQNALSQDPLQTIQNNDASTAPDALSPDALSPDALSPDALSPDALSPDALSPDALSPDALSPDELSPDELSPDALSPDALSPDALSPDELSPDAYSGAQTATILRISAHEGTSPEQIIQDTWSNTGDFYIRVRGHNGAYSPDGFQLTVEETSTACTGVILQPYAATAGPAGTPTTLILTNSARFGGVAANYASKLSAFAARSDVNGLVIDLATNAGIAPAYAQWDANNTCPAAANVVADAIKALVDQYRPSLRYVVLAGGDHVIPYFRTPDQAGLGIETGFNPGLFQDTASEASLQFGYTLTQDSYGTKSPIAHFDHSFFMPDLPVGRLVESSTDIIAVLDAYTAANGVVHVAGGHAVDSGYDFLSDTATFIQTSLAPSLTVDPLIQLRGQAPWTADQLRAKLFAQHNDIVALNGHFSANTLLASDFATRITSDEVAQFMALFTNSLVISSGCHSGYNIVDPDALPTTKSVDWVQSLARAGAETIGSTGYAYGDTDFMKYTELILGNFTTELRYDTGAIAIGQALVNAKRAYAASLPALRGIDEKALMEATLYGLPMWSIDLGTNGRLVRPGTASGISPAPVTGVSGLSSSTVAPTYALNRHPASGNGDAGVYYDANGNIAVAPGAPVLPLTSQNVAVAGSNARGVVLMDATYVDEGNVTPFTDVAGTDLAGMHPGYASPVFAPVRTFALNSLSGITTFVTTPAQYKTTTANTGILRRWTSESFQLFYSSRTDAAAAFAGSPVVYSVDVTPGTGSAVRFSATVGALADPGFAGAYLTYTAEQGSQYGTWHSVPMTQVGTDLSTGTFGITRTYAAEVTPGTGATAGDLRAFVQIVGGNGLVSMNTNNGEYYKLVPETATTAAPKQTTSLAISAPASATYLGSATVSATLTGGGSAVAGVPVTLTLGTQRADVVTGTGGVATATFVVSTAPGSTTAGASFAEDQTHLASSATAAVTITPAAPSLTGAPATMQYTDSAVIATLHLGGGSDPQSVTLAANGATISALSDPLGRIRLDTRDLPLTPGANSVVVSFAGNDRFTAGSTTVQVTQTAEDATLTVPAYAPQPVGSLPVSAQVAQAGDGSLGDLTKAKVTFALRNEGGTVVGTVIGNVSAGGASSASFANVGAGLYHVEATVSGGYFSSPLVYSIAVVYDSSTFVTGGGSVLTTTSSTGLVAGKKANFGFNAKYLSGTTIPTGSVEFSAKESNVTFKATGFDWLVISSGRAELQGTGTVNGAGSYSFRLVAIDGSPDSFAIRIWNATTSYDLPLYMVSAPLSSGNNVVH